MSRMDGLDVGTYWHAFIGIHWHSLAFIGIHWLTDVKHWPVSPTYRVCAPSYGSLITVTTVKTVKATTIIYTYHHSPFTIHCSPFTIHHSPSSFTHLTASFWDQHDRTEASPAGTATP